MRPGLIVYLSEHTHSSSEKAAIALGFGQENIRKIGVDPEFRMTGPNCWSKPLRRMLLPDCGPAR